jgi:hypothetical protein
MPKTPSGQISPGFTFAILPKHSHISLAIFCLGLLLAFFPRSLAAANETPIHGLWVWKGPSVLQGAHDDEMLRDFCNSGGINEVYVSISSHGEPMSDPRVSQLIELLHRSHIRVEALLSSENADESGKHREKLLDHVREIILFNQKHPNARFDGIHLDIEPQQRPENKGPGNLRFLPGLVEAYRDVRAVAEPARLTVNADIQNKLLKGDLAQRRILLSSLSRLTLMLYELSSPNDGQTIEQKIEKLEASSKKFLDMAYEGLNDPNLARMIVGLRTPDYHESLPKMLTTLDNANLANSRYIGWARHSYNDSLHPQY